jgi:hypothetical protein
MMRNSEVISLIIILDIIHCPNYLLKTQHFES